MNKKYMYSLLAVIVLILLPYVGVEAVGLQVLFGIIIPYLAVLIFIIGFIYRVMDWASSPVPFRIPSTCGQQKSLPWIKQNKIDNPFTAGGVIIRMILEILFFRSLFRNTRFGLNEGPKISYVWEKWLWLAALAFHYSFLTVLIRHLRFFLEPVPVCLQLLEKVDGFFQVGLPGLYMSGAVLLAAVTFLFLRRIYLPQMRYISLAADFFPLFLIISIAITGILMRYFTKVDVVGIKELAMGLASFHPTIPDGIGVLFYVHLFLVSILFVYFPFSKLMHMGGIFLSPTRNLPNNTRAKMHINPWNYPVKVHTYDEYEDEFREKMKEVGLPLEKE
ncbi:MAG: sulfate reduction electron transfer complex DsrMKJOP subunit DsrM [Desulfobacterales bacterium]|uniref:Sulfate reduction electron transfer complex DsrMKJOP subunit DsrM n=1 Tax=Candidatus Desulfaltia bathyphila TaxID=2841697 RepID=A0A8J6N820_9BACT|nr:sulfate reduction electron transfer complex DsrMKJOP subunit DsrM [Candidatus Desulfaltia bathyphila]MBL7194906.1 sulfate reduction electron transfer complex DsrMKJOP subunit DsrM [Desulfobacterales bacterium]MBL7206896.1 sulfate reduction electron transfer complex DsrMKJOP subunit DsrM [Desulfobacterales bacterium]